MTSNRLIGGKEGAASNGATFERRDPVTGEVFSVAAAATEMRPSEDSKLFRFTMKHSIFLASVVGLIVVFYAYVAPQLAP